MTETNILEIGKDAQVVETVTRHGLDMADMELKEKSALILVKAHELVIASGEDMARADNLYFAVRTVRKQIAGLFDGLINTLHKAHREGLARKGVLDIPLEKAEFEIKRKMGVFEENRRRQEREAEEARLKAEDEARKKADDDLRRAAELEDKGDTAAATEIVDKVIAEAEKPVVPAVAPPPPRPVMAGTSFRTYWKFEIVDATKVPLKYLCPDETKIRKVVDALMGATDIPGVRVYSETQAIKRIPPKP